MKSSSFDRLTSLNRELLQSNDDVVLGSIGPAVLFYQCSSNFFEVFVVEDSLWAALHIDLVTSLD